MIVFSFIFCLALYSVGKCAQPNFPPQITFSPDDDQSIIAIDEINQHAYMTLRYGTSDH